MILLINHTGTVQIQYVNVLYDGYTFVRDQDEILLGMNVCHGSPAVPLPDFTTKLARADYEGTCYAGLLRNFFTSSISIALQMLPEEKHVVAVKASGTLRAYVGYAQRMLDDPNVACVRFEAIGKMAGKAVSVAEIVKRGRHGLHQVTELKIDENGCTQSCLSILLAASSELVDTRHPGYIAPTN